MPPPGADARPAPKMFEVAGTLATMKLGVPLPGVGSSMMP